MLCGGALKVPRILGRFRSPIGCIQWSRLLRRPVLHTEVDRNIWYLYVEVFWAAILSAAASFNAAFAVRLGASNQMIGWLSSIPSLIAVLLLIPSARFLESKARRTPWLWSSLFVARLGYLVLALLPWVLKSQQAEAVVWLLIAITVPATFFSAGFSPLLADLIPERDRARVFANRNIIVSATVAALTFAAGRWLEGASAISWSVFPTNYQVMYLVGFAGATASSLALLRIKVPESKIVNRSGRVKVGRPSVAALRTMLAENRDFVRITLNTLLFDLGAWLVGPLYILFFVRELGASDGWIGLNNTLANLGVIAGYALWRRLIRRWGYGRTLLISVPMAASYAFLVALIPDLSAILVWGVLINLVNPGVTLSHFNMLLKMTPDDRRASYMAIYASIMNVGAFVGPAVGVALADLWDIRTVLVVGGVIRLLGAGLFYLFRVQVEETEIG
jgi:MFS family permease